MKPGQMMSIRIYNSQENKFQTSFIIKDFSEKVENISKSCTFDARCYLDAYGNATSLIYLIAFGENNRYIYDYWFNYYSKSINSHELEDLSHQDTIEYLLVDHKNNMVDVISIQNFLFMAIPQYVNIAKQIHWTSSEFAELKANVMKKFINNRGIWKHVSKVLGE
jgi:hypothetical protein